MGKLTSRNERERMSQSLLLFYFILRAFFVKLIDLRVVTYLEN